MVEKPCTHPHHAEMVVLTDTVAQAGYRCECGHAPMDHRGISEICMFIGCDCVGYRRVR